MEEKAKIDAKWNDKLTITLKKILSANYHVPLSVDFFSREQYDDMGREVVEEMTAESWIPPTILFLEQVASLTGAPNGPSIDVTPKVDKWMIYDDDIQVLGSLAPF